MMGLFDWLKKNIKGKTTKNKKQVIPILEVKLDEVTIQASLQNDKSKKIESFKYCLI